MLVLSRKKNQSIVIEGGIEIQVLQLKGGAVKIGISAPSDVRIVRGELKPYSEMIPAETGTLESATTESESAESDPLEAAMVRACVDELAEHASDVSILKYGQAVKSRKDQSNSVDESRLEYLSDKHPEGVFAK